METETVAEVKRCSACGENLSQVTVTDYERRTRIDGAAQASMRLDKKNHWVHVFFARDITLKRLRAKRGSVAMDEINTWAPHHSTLWRHYHSRLLGLLFQLSPSLRMDCADHICYKSSNSSGPPRH